MATQYVPLKIVTLENDADLTHPRSLPELVYIDDPATYVMHDFQHEEPIALEAHEKTEEIEHDLQIAHVHETLVMENDKITGIINTRDLTGIKPTKISQEKQIERSEVTAKMLMTPCKDILCFDYDEIIHARVGNVAATLNLHKKNYALVVEQDGEHQIVRGLISAITMTEQLGHDITKIG